MAFRFQKYEGLGNDFIVVDRLILDAAHVELDVELAKRLCDRHRGVGADGVLIVSTDGDRASMEVINADGSSPEMCGNGLRCVAWYLLRTADRASGTIDVDTVAGTHTCVVENGDTHSAQVEVQMAVPNFDLEAIGLAAGSPWIDEPVVFGSAELGVTAVSMGNPHAVVFDETHDPLIIAPRIQTDPRFKHGVNVGFASMRGDGGIDLRVLERGAGWTQACGTGACASVAAAVRTERVEPGQEVSVHLPGGVLQIRVTLGQRVVMKGPARFVFDGHIDT